MNGSSVSKQDGEITSLGHPGGLEKESSLQRDSLFSSPSVPNLSQLLSQTIGNRTQEPKVICPSSQIMELLHQDGEDSSSREGTQALAPPLSHTPIFCFGDKDEFGNEHLRAKRARVESIIQGMSLSPNPIALGASAERDREHNTEKRRESCRENKRKQKLPQQQSPHVAQLVGTSANAEEHHYLKEQLQVLQQQLRQLQEKFFQVYELNDSDQTQEGTEQIMHLLTEKHGDSLEKSIQALTRDQHKVLCRSTSEMEGHKVLEEESKIVIKGDLSSEERTLSETLKGELARVVSQAVDSVLKKILSSFPGHLSQMYDSLPMATTDNRREHLASVECSRKKQFPKASSQNLVNSLAEAQTEALSLVLEKSPDFPTYPVSLRGVRKPCQVPNMSYPLLMSSQVQENQILSQLLGYGQNGHWNSRIASSPDRSSPASLDQPWGAVKLRSSVMRQQQYPTSPNSTQMESLAFLSAGKAECRDLQSIMDGMSFSSIHIQEALTPGHLKKAKLMFFFTRYPSSTLLKTYFLDVQFNRCITSQLIKWFSNFREFYYIQMEKFARQAILEGVTDCKDLMVSRNSELFRALNMHYNKGNDFEVPDRFLEVASLTLQEFFSAVKAGKDSDPSWKKPIYKIISKLDSDIPEAFKSSSCPQELLQS
ncbi:prospero homeobox protein 2 isoform X1 [Alligator sinensis]|uniref:Prospero homeobox protein 2 isoform X1 n=2 Tax=Alligator sinensis TaxID=38654 RepID=A0A3Q0GAP3_ALLSI|nr:prospero homeobox protein 2 isoform X1 [Alligator sinensis]XP_025056712.1 prospero homeobox protein 2 isoform X1 [Alligator sinensis]XP_025056717.1 prospero homeobox protein 2 isoform X1 [Alligator sinensis]XP_025056721.1 prospero homeobox protein 2 isoform X1 [Alligator sinensis]XP_025056726.1 prospero homeobox protein 2 isoform X1 [Alligator sinensis]XP_025056731.1 prospero homeobox protein 2 isoform X1 [Alligator sinensis]XP_025056736.1 prospero homeobox protein 2 isoform X1 [Alligator 